MVQSTKQQQILGFFIEEAKEHLDTIEQGLLHLQATMADAEEMNQLFRAAHSIKGGAAMLGFDSIQKTAHHLEDYFKLLKDNPIKVDRKLEDLFLKGFDTLKALVELLQNPFGFRPEEGEKAVRDSEPTFAELGLHLNRLIHSKPAPTAPIAPVATSNAAAHVNQILKLMLQLFKQGDNPKGRQQLMVLCAKLIQLSKTNPAWVSTIQTAQRAIANPRASFSRLAPLVIKELKQASDLLLTGRASEIVPSNALQQLANAAPVSQVDPKPATRGAMPNPSPAAMAPVAPASSSPAEAEPILAEGLRQRQIAIPADPRGAARALVDNFNKTELIQIAEFLMQSIQ